VVDAAAPGLGLGSVGGDVLLVVDTLELYGQSGRIEGNELGPCNQRRSVHERGSGSIYLGAERQKRGDAEACGAAHAMKTLCP